ncbi:DUF4170 domain-containing protein [Marinibaculum pumilum]|uniref:DUF4170 domain-containing protein n=1 Tax=Marinibaculum pumilum TaxID=1766165 RepID=A0ABV7L0Y2_9PROT
MREQDSDGPFYVVGGIYKNTKFTKLAPGEELQVFGPFDTHGKADDVWRDKSFAMVDNAMARFTVRSQHELEEIEHKILKQKKKDQKKAQGKD